MAIAPTGSSEASQRRGFAFGLLAAVIWGGYIAVSHHGMEAGLEAADLAFLRFSVAGLILLPWLARNDLPTLAGLGWRRGMILALLAGPLFVLAGASGFLFAPLAHSAVIQLGMVTFMGIIFSVAMLGEHLGRRQLAGAAIIVAGLAITAGPALFGGRSGAWRGDVLFALAGTMWALFTTLQRRWQVRPLAATAAVSVLSAVFYSPLYLTFGEPAHLLAASVLLLLQQAVVLGLLSGVVALYAFARAVENLGAARASIFPAFAPAVAMLIGIPLSGEWPTPWQLLGLATLSIGLVLAIWSAGGAVRRQDAAPGSVPVGEQEPGLAAKGTGERAFCPAVSPPARTERRSRRRSSRSRR